MGNDGRFERITPGMNAGTHYHSVRRELEEVYCITRF